MTGEGSVSQTDMEIATCGPAIKYGLFHLMQTD